MQMSRTKKWLLGSGIAVVLIVVGAVVIYLTLIKSDAPPPLTLSSVAATTPSVSAADNGSTTTESSSSSSLTDLSATWKVTNASQVGYRVTEDLIGGLANNVAVGRRMRSLARSPWPAPK